MIGCVGAPGNQELVLIDCAGFPGVSGMQLDVSGNAGKARWQIGLKLMIDIAEKP